MSCYFPLIGVPVGTFDSGKTKYSFRSCTNSADIKLELDANHGSILVPCGRCLGCRLDQSREWANRLMMELEYYDSAFFVTLTYDDAHVPKSEYVDQNTGEVCHALTLRKRDFQLFMKRLRKRFPNDHIRFYACGEYGSETFRPHFHAIIYGLHLDDLQIYKRSPEGFVYWNSDSLSSCWSVYHRPAADDPVDQSGWYEPLGFAVCAEVDWNTCAYTARYVTKKLTGDLSVFYSDLNIEPPFSLMSRRDGIGKQYYLDHPEGMARDRFCLSSGRKIRPPRYFDKLYDLDNPEGSAIIKEVRKFRGQMYEQAELAKTDLRKDEYLQVKYEDKKRQVSKLRRCTV